MRSDDEKLKFSKFAYHSCSLWDGLNNPQEVLQLVLSIYVTVYRWFYHNMVFIVNIKSSFILIFGAHAGL